MKRLFAKIITSCNNCPNFCVCESDAYLFYMFCKKDKDKAVYLLDDSAKKEMEILDHWFLNCNVLNVLEES